MLNRSERHRTLKSYRVLSILGLLPIEVDLAQWKLRAPSKRKRWICFLFLGSFLFHTLYKTGSLAYAYFLDPNVKLHELVIHAALVMGSIMNAIFYFVVYISDSSLFAAYVNVTLRGNIGGPLGEEDRMIKHWKARMWEYSMQDWIAVSLPNMVTLVIPLTIIACVYAPSMKLLLHAAFPSYLQHWTTFGLTLFEENRFMMVMAAIDIPIWQLQVISFELVCQHLNLLIGRIKNGNHGARSTFMQLRSLQLYISILNKVNSHLIFTCKLTCLAVGIITGYSAVAHFREHPIFGILYCLFLLDATLIYTLIYGKAFKIPQLMDQAAASALLHMRGPGRGAFKRQILSVPSTGIKVGSFHTLERASTLIYIDFVVKNIVSMLVAYG